MDCIRMVNVSKEIKGIEVLKNINLNIKKGSIVGITGINGSGKTMLLRAISGLIKTDGEIYINDKKIENGEFPENIGVLIEIPGFLPEFTGKRNLQLLGMLQDNIKDEDIDKALIRVGLSPDDKRHYKKYSLGMRERLGIAQAIMGEPEIILLDEPTNGIDESGIKILKDLIMKLKLKGMTLVIASHDREFLEDIEDERYEMKEGKLIVNK